MLRSREKSDEFCSLLCAYCLLDVIVNSDVSEGLTPPPLHKKMAINFSKNKVRIHLDLCQPPLTVKIEISASS